jgi:flagellar motor switch protein FliG
VKPLFDGKGEEEEPSKGCQAQKALDLSALKGRVPDYVLSILEKCVKEIPEERFPNTAELMSALEEAQFRLLADLTGYDILRLLRDMEDRDLAVALSGACEAITAHVLSSVDDDVADWIRREMADNSPTPEAAHAARAAVVATANRLLDEQRISF